MEKIDGSSGGGQILRTAVGISTLCQIPIKVENIRSSRPKPGLNAQHIESINTLKEVCNAKVSGVYEGSQNIEFIPEKIEEKNIRVNISTAGSVSLVLQSILTASIGFEKRTKIEFSGGATYGKWAPTIDYTENVLFPILEKFGFSGKIKTKRHGFFPKGDSVVKVDIKPFDLEKIKVNDRGEQLSVKGISVASKSLQDADVAKRQKTQAVKVLLQSDIRPKISEFYESSTCPGSGVQLWANYENSIMGASSIGQRGKPSESVGAKAAHMLLEEEYAVDTYAADQLLPFMAFFGGAINAPITNHVKSNIATIEGLIGSRFNVTKNEIKVTESYNL